MIPPLGDLKTKIPPAQGDTIKGIYFAPNTEVAVNDESMCHDTAVFGEDANVYRPDRWMEAEANAEKKLRFRHTVDTVFGSGRFQCLRPTSH